MPLYEYQCRKCGRIFEELVLGSGEKIECPDCSSLETRKLLSSCRAKFGTSDSLGQASAPGMSGGGCSGCSGGSCSTCG
jgi:putative FmdB family regulatory protein